MRNFVTAEHHEASHMSPIGLHESACKWVQQCLVVPMTSKDYNMNILESILKWARFVLKWALILGALFLFDQGCSPRDTSRMPQPSILMKSYHMYQPSTIRQAYHAMDSIHKTDPYAQHEDSQDSLGTATDTTQVDSTNWTILHRADYYIQNIAKMNITEGTAAVLPLCLIMFAIVILTGYIKMRRNKTRVRLHHRAKGIDSQGRNKA